ncbi:MAG: glycosyltransferase family 4 protein, partial [Ruminococcus sp.]|nr:glycosyltransferase family 4 protein [Ruminococcus sp.]
SYWNHGMLGKLVAPYMYYKTRSIIGKADYVYYVTTKFLQKRYPTKGKTVCCSNVVLEKVDDSVLYKRLEKISQFDKKGKIVLGTAAAIDTRYKGHEYVIKAMPELVAEGYDVEYHLAGGVTGAKENTFLHDLAVECGVIDRVKFMGSLPADKMNAYYDSLDVYVQPSKQEGLPRSVIEAMSRGCPCIGTSIAGTPELLQEMCLFHKGSSIEFKKALLRVLDSDMSLLAKENFNKAKEYEKTVLRKKREAFYDVFLIDNSNK